MKAVVPLAAIVILVSLTCATVQGENNIVVKARLDPPFVIEEMTIKVSESVRTLTFNTSLFTDAIDYFFAVAGGRVYRGIKNDTTLSFQFETPVNEAKVWIVVRALSTEGPLTSLTMPITLVPYEVRECNTSFLLYDLPAQPEITYSPFNLSSGYDEIFKNFLQGNSSGRAGEARNITLTLTGARLSPAVLNLTRTVILEARSIKLIDNYTFIGLSGYSTADLFFTYTVPLELANIRGLTGPYPPTQYTAEKLGNSTVLKISMLAPPYQRGDSAYLQLEFFYQNGNIGDRYKLPIFTGVGRYLQSLRIIVKVRGEITGIGSLEGRQEGEYKVYEMGTFKLVGVEVDPIVEVEASLVPHRQFVSILGAVALTCIVAASYLLVLRRKKGEVQPLVEEVELVSSELSNTLAERLSNVEAMLEAWERFSSGRLSRQAYRQLSSRIRKREIELKKLSRDLSKDGNITNIIEEIDKIIQQIEKNILEMEDIHRNIERGLIPKKEGKAKINSIERTIKELRNELEELINRLSSS
ncbi:MAG: hypothetical protein NZ954_02740 [Thermofilaceae archaeon]|nr:hypothetical protein [Thermofilaceae archaeon]MDW8004793.1 hypothetical protein [Thermofilaceae archaeon]